MRTPFRVCQRPNEPKSPPLESDDLFFYVKQYQITLLIGDSKESEKEEWIIDLHVRMLAKRLIFDKFYLVDGKMKNPIVPC